jgi:hypothetical protein
VERTFTIRVPEGTAPGQYITSIAAEQADASGIEGTDVLSQNLRYTVPVFITVPGPTESSFEVGEIDLTIQDDMLLLVVPLSNTGDVRVRPQGTIEIVDTTGALVASIPVAMESIYAREGTALSLATPATIVAGTYRVIVKLSDSETGAKASAESGDFEIDPSAQPATLPIQITTASISPAPTADNVQFATVEATLLNEGEPIVNAQLSLIASVDGAEVERFPISQSLSLPTGDTPITTRYIPATGWTSGSWTFELLLETVEPSGAAVVVGRQPIEGAIVIP